MRNTPSLLLVVIAILACLSHLSLGDYSEDFETDLKEKGRDFAFEKIINLSSDEREVALNSIAHKLHEIGEEPDLIKDLQPFVMASAALLVKIGADEQITTAFGNLSSFGNAEADAAKALASCKSAAGVDILRKLAEKRIIDIQQYMVPPDEEGKKILNEKLIQLTFLIERLDGAVNPAGPSASKKLMDDFAARYSSEAGKLFVRAMGEEIASARERRMKISPSPNILSKGNTPNADSPQKMHEQLDPHKQRETPLSDKHSEINLAIVVIASFSGIGLLCMWLKRRSTRC